MERFRGSYNLQEQKGATLVELMIAVAISGMILYTASTTLQLLTEHKSAIEMKATVESLRVNFFETVLDSEALEKTFEDTANASFACLKDATTPCPAGDTPLKLLNRKGQVLYDPSDEHKTDGFSREGRPCTTFGEETSDYNCPFRFEFTWRAVCETCSMQQFEIGATVKFRPGVTMGTPINENALHFKVVRNFPFSDSSQPYEVFVSEHHVCAVMLNGRMKCFGMNATGMLGLEDTADRISASQMGNALPYVDVGPNTVRSVMTLPYANCALLSDDTVRCWGASQYYLENGWFGAEAGSMGAGLEAFTGAFGGKTPKRLSSHAAHTSCVVMTDGTATCWSPDSGGSRSILYGPPGGPVSQADIDSRILSFKFKSPITDVSAGGFQLCFLLGDIGPSGGGNPPQSNIICWGGDHEDKFNYGQIGNGHGDSAALANITYGKPGFEVPTPKQTTFNRMHNDNHVQYVNLQGRRARQVSSGDLHVCAILSSDDSVWCWGRNAFGELGQWDTASGKVKTSWRVQTPVRVDNLGGPAATVSAAETTTCALLKSGVVKCWGALNGQQAPLAPPTIKNFGGKKVTKLASSVVDNYCAITEDYQTYCWNDAAPGKVAFAYHEDHEAYEHDDTNNSFREGIEGFRIPPDVYQLVKWFD